MPSTRSGRRAGLLAATCGLALMLAAAWPALAADAGTPHGPVSASPDLRASRLLGREVRDPQGRDLGEVRDLIVDLHYGRLHYAILAFGGVLGLGEKLHAVPVSTLQWTGARWVLDLPRGRVERAPGFERSRWPDWQDHPYRDAVDRHFGSDVAPRRDSGERLMRITRLLGLDVEDRDGRELGEIEDVIVNLGRSELRYVVLELDERWQPGDKLLPLPLGALSVPQGRGGDALLNVPRDQLDPFTSFDEDRWPDLDDPAFRDQVDRLLRVDPPAR